MFVYLITLLVHLHILSNVFVTTAPYKSKNRLLHVYRSTNCCCTKEEIKNSYIQTAVGCEMEKLIFMVNPDFELHFIIHIL